MVDEGLPIHLDPTQPTPIYQQLVDQVRYHVARGALRPEDELPSVRVLSTRHLINPNTVVRAYQELEREGLVYKRRGTGTFVSPQAGRMVEAERRRIVTAALAHACRQARALGVPAEAVRAELDRLLREEA